MTFPFTQDDEEEPQPAFMTEEETEGEEGAPEEESNNRTFLIVAAVLGGIVLLSLICMAAYALVFLPQQRAAQSTQQAQINFNNTQVAGAFTATAQVLLATPTAEPTSTPTETVTPVLAQPTATADLATPDPITATVAAAYTQAAIGQLTVVPTSTALGTAFAAPSQVPATGFADEVGLPGLMIAAAVLMVIIFLARRARAMPVR